MRILTCLTCVALCCAAPAAAQMSVTTIGSTDAASCYENARDDFARSTAPCDKALKDAGLSISDRKKTFVNRGVIHNRNGDLGAALDDFNEAIDIDDALGEAYLNRGNSYYLASRLDDAMADYQRALDFGINKPWAAWYNIGLVYEAKKQPDKAREAYEKALSVNPDFTQAQQKLEG